jgi:hypothetical protein
MSDIRSGPQSAPPPLPDYEFQLAKARIENSAAYVGKMIWLITLIAGAISVIVVVSVVVLAITQILISGSGHSLVIPDVLVNWGGIILGFYFGQFINLVKDYMGLVTSTNMLAAGPPRAPGPQ